MRAVYVGLYSTPPSPLPGSSYWLVMMWGYDVIFLGESPREKGEVEGCSTPRDTCRASLKLAPKRCPKFPVPLYIPYFFMIGTLELEERGVRMIAEENTSRHIWICLPFVIHSSISMA